VEEAIQQKPLVLPGYVIYKSDLFHHFGPLCQQGAEAFFEKLWHTKWFSYVEKDLPNFGHAGSMS